MKADNSNDNIPVAKAEAIVPFTSTSSSITYVNLPPGYSGLKLKNSQGYPVQIVSADKTKTNLPANNNTIADLLKPNMYIHSIQIAHDLVITHLNDATRAQQILDSNIQNERRLGVSSESPVVGNPNDGFYYAHTLPSSDPACTLEALQLTLEGFPPRIATVGTNSPLSGKLHPHQVIVSLQIPNRTILNQQTPGFTGYKIQTELQSFCANNSTSTNDNKKADAAAVVLTVKDELVRRKIEKGSRAAFDDCIVS